MTWTPLHAALGITSGDALTFGMLESACSKSIPEAAGLDWKRTLPLTDTQDGEAKKQQQSELAKDLAAMANTGGGLIVYGVAERDDSSGAGTLVTLGPITEGTTSRIHLTAASLIYPPIVGLEPMPLTSPDGDTHLLAIMVPDSLDAPHLVHPRGKNNDWFTAPWRNGAHTSYMSERQLADAYNRRERGRRQIRRDLTDTWDELRDSVPSTTNRPWVLAVARPERPHPHPRDLTTMRTRAILRSAQCYLSQPESGSISSIQATDSSDIRRGRQRFLRRTSPTGAESAQAQVEVHGDGTVAVAIRRTEKGFGGGHVTLVGGEVAICDLQQAGLDVLALLMALTDRGLVHSDYTARLGLSCPTQIFRRSDPTGISGFAPWGGEDERVLSYPPVDSTIIATGGREQLVHSAVDWATDAAHQAGAMSSIDPSSVLTRLAAD